MKKVFFILAPLLAGCDNNEQVQIVKGVLGEKKSEKPLITIPQNASVSWCNKFTKNGFPRYEDLNYQKKMVIGCTQAGAFGYHLDLNLTTWAVTSFKNLSLKHQEFNDLLKREVALTYYPPSGLNALDNFTPDLNLKLKRYNDNVTPTSNKFSFAPFFPWEFFKTIDEKVKANTYPLRFKYPKSISDELSTFYQKLYKTYKNKDLYIVAGVGVNAPKMFSLHYTNNTSQKEKEKEKEKEIVDFELVQPSFINSLLGVSNLYVARADYVFWVLRSGSSNRFYILPLNSSEDEEVGKIKQINFGTFRKRTGLTLN